MKVSCGAYIGQTAEANPAPNLLVVDTVAPIRSLLVGNLRCAGFVASGAGSAGEALTVLAAITPDLVIMNIDIADASAKELAESLRAKNIPWLILADARGQAGAAGLPALLKPFSPQEFVAGIVSMLRFRARPQPSVALCVGQLSLDAEAHEVRWQGRRIDLQPLAFRLLTVLMRHAGRVHTRASLLNAIWGVNSEAGERAIDVQVRRLRAALAAEGCTRSVETLRGVGYRLALPVDLEPSPAAVARLRQGEKAPLRTRP